MIEPADVVALLNRCDDTSDPFAAVEKSTLRELLTVWLRVAQLHELIEMNPGEHTAEERAAARTLLLGLPDDPPDTEPQNEKPTVAMLKCTCGYHGPINDDYTCPHCSEFVH